MGYTYDHPRPAVTVDAVVFARGDGHWTVLLIQRGQEPFAGSWALPGGFVEMDETLERAAARELEEETGITGVELEQLRVFGDPGRDPRGRTISIVHWGIVEGREPEPRGLDDAAEAAWWRTDMLPELAFDHEAIIAVALVALRTRVDERNRADD
jgi:8-oxo-dGTP diphosphatase